MRLLVSWAIIAVSVALAALLIPGITIVDTNGWLAVIVMAAVLGIVNAVIRPILRLLSCGLIILTLGLFSLVINAATFALASWLAVTLFGAGFYIDGFWSAFFGALIVSVVSTILGALFLGNS
ncbi:MAG: phage holin family protein [Chloroflexota bacterium]|nr:phage holin family protein [Dehalococcoidia bacterium]MDW8253604.1 phage holin family protein [Chloroflexota bacterium]